MFPKTSAALREGSAIGPEPCAVSLRNDLGTGPEVISLVKFGDDGGLAVPELAASASTAEWAAIDCDDSDLAEGDGKVPDSSRRSSSGVIWGAVRRPGELRVVAGALSPSAGSDGGVIGSREATRGVVVLDEENLRF